MCPICMDMVVDNTTYQLRNTTLCTPDKNNSIQFTRVYLVFYTAQIEEENRVISILGWIVRRHYITEERDLADASSMLSIQ